MVATWLPFGPLATRSRGSRTTRNTPERPQNASECRVTSASQGRDIFPMRFVPHSPRNPRIHGHERKVGGGSNGIRTPLYAGNTWSHSMSITAGETSRACSAYQPHASETDEHSPVRRDPAPSWPNGIPSFRIRLAALDLEWEQRVNQRGPPVGVDELAGDPRGVGRAEQADDVADVARRAHSAHGRPAAPVPLARDVDRGVTEALQHTVVRESGADRVDGDPARSERDGKVSHERLQRRLGRPHRDPGLPGATLPTRRIR